MLAWSPATGLRSSDCCNYVLNKKARPSNEAGPIWIRRVAVSGLQSTVFLSCQYRTCPVFATPDGKQAIWFGGYPARTLDFFDSREAAVRTVARGWLAGGLHWLTEEELVPLEQTSEIAKGWLPFADQPKSKPRPDRSDTRKKVTDHL